MRTGQGVWMGAISGVVAVALAGSAFAAAPALAARPEVVSPKPGAHVLIGHDRLVVRVKLLGQRRNAGRKNLRAYLDGREVTARLTRLRGSQWRGVLRAGRDYGPRDHVLTVRIGRRLNSSVDTVHFFAMKRDDSAMRVAYSTGWRSRAGNLLRVRTRRRLWNASGMPRVVLNGHRVDGRLDFREDDRGFGGGLGPDAGLRFGRNRIEVETLQRDGTYARSSRRFWVPRDRPLAGAGPDRRAGVGESVTLDGSSSRPAPAGAETGSSDAAGLRFRWRIVRAPHGSQAGLDEPTSVAPTLTPDLPGTYVVSLTATPTGGGMPGVDEVTVTAPQSDSPMGMPIQTITDQGAIQIGEKSYPRRGEGVKMLVLSASALVGAAGPWGPAEQTFTPQANGEWRSPGNPQDLLASIEAVGGQSVVVLSGQGAPLGGGQLSAAQSESLGKAIAAIGGTVAKSGQTGGAAADLANGQWSVIGHRGLTEGHAQQNYFLGEEPIPAAAVPEFPTFPTDAGAPGSLNGYMQMVNEAAYQFVSPEYAEIDTKWTPSLKQAPSPTQNTIAVAGQHYASDPIPNGAIGMQLLVLSASAPFKVLEQGTFTILNPDCSTNYGGGGIYSLDQALNRWVNAPNPAGTKETNLVVLQDFGRQTGTCWPGGNDVDWLQDSLPSVAANGEGWVGSSFPTEPEKLFQIWNRANVHGFGSVAGNIGKLAGIPAHDVVANYRRPFYDDQTRQMVNRDFGGLTVVASTNLYQWSSAFFKGQGDDPSLSEAGNELLDNGRVTGILRRNEQAQWELQDSALGAGWPTTSGESGLNQKALWDLVFQRPAAWPCTPEDPSPCPGTAAEVEAAQRYFVSQVSPRSGVASVRDLYADHYMDGFSVGKLQRPYPQQPTEFGSFSKPLYEALRNGVGGTWHGLVGEFEDLNQVSTGIGQWQNFFIAVGGNSAQVDIAGVGQQVVSNVNDVYSKLLQQDQEAEVEGGEIASDVLYALSSIVDVSLVASGDPEAIPIVSPSLGALGALIGLGNDVAAGFAEDGPSDGESNVRNDTNGIRDKVSQLSSDVAARYEAIAQTMGHFGGVFADDPGKLQVAAENFDPGGPWSMSSETQTQVRMGQAMSTAVQRATYETTLPIALTEWVVSPRYTNVNGLASLDVPRANTYQCVDAHSEEPASRREPWTGTSTWVMSSSGWTGGGPTAGTNFTPQNSTNYLIRGLKSNVDNMEPGWFEAGESIEGRERIEPGLDHSGTSAPQGLLEPLFGTYSAFGTAADPGPLGASKEEIFGMGSWSTLKFQCGHEP